MTIRMQSIVIHRTVLVWLMLLGSFALAQGTYTQIDVPGAVGTYAAGINSSGHISGAYLDSAEFWHGYLLEDGNFTTIDYPANSNTLVNGINDADHLVGDTSTPGPVTGFVYNAAKASFRLFNVAPYGISAATAINNSDAVVGIDNFNQGFELAGSKYTKIFPPDSQAGYLYGITSVGAVVGHGIKNDGLNAPFQWFEGQFRQIAIPGTRNAVAYGVSSDGHVVVGGYVLGQTDVTFLYTKADLRTLQYPGAVSTTAIGVNVQGQVVGVFFDNGGNEHGFLYTPSKEAF